MSSRFIHVVAWVRTSFLRLHTIPLCGYTTFCLSLHSSRILGLLCLSITMTIAGMNISVTNIYSSPCFQFSEYTPRGGIAGTYDDSNTYSFFQRKNSFFQVLQRSLCVAGVHLQYGRVATYTFPWSNVSWLKHSKGTEKNIWLCPAVKCFPRREVTNPLKCESANNMWTLKLDSGELLLRKCFQEIQLVCFVVITWLWPAWEFRGQNAVFQPCPAPFGEWLVL